MQPLFLVSDEQIKINESATREPLSVTRCNSGK
jgi:hypothetical protein